MIIDNYELNGPFNLEICEYIKFKRALGYDYNQKIIRFYRMLDNFFKEHNIIDVEMPEDIVELWIAKKENEAPSNQGQRYFLTRCFAEYLLSKGYKNIYIPELHLKQFQTKFIPYIFTKEEVLKIFKFFDILSIREKNKTPRDKMYCVLFRLLYSTGIRISEAFKLKWENVDLKYGILTIIDSKNHVSRTIPISKSMISILKNFKLQNIYPLSDYLFKNINDKISYNSVRRYFYQALEYAKIPRRNDMMGPRIHDFRHTFAVHSLTQMADLGMDIYVCLPLLSKYMGHSDIKNTEYYLRLTKDRFEYVTSTSQKYCKDLFPKVGE